MRELRGLRVVFVSIAVCVLVGVPLGTFLGGVFSGAPSLVLSRDIAGVPVLAYALITVGPLATMAGVTGGVVLLALLRSKRWDPPWPGWALVGALSGALVAGILPGLLWATENGALPMLGLCALTGGLCGALLGVYGRLEKRGVIADANMRRGMERAPRQPNEDARVRRTNGPS